MTTSNKQITHLKGAFLLRRFAAATLCLAAFSILVGAIADGFRPTNAVTQQDQVNVGIRRDMAGSISITATNDAPCSNYDTTNSTLDMTVHRNSIAADCITIAVNTDDVNGYTLNINGPASGNLVGETGGELIEAKTTGTMAAPTTFTNVGTDAAWGFGIPSGQIQGLTLGFDSAYQRLGASNTVNTSKYAAVPTTPTSFSKTGRANALDGDDAPIDDIYNIFFAATANTTLAGDAYSGIVTISGMVNANPSFLPPSQTGQRIQTITAANCPADRTRVIDARDGATYWVRKVGDLCWMETNLAYAGGGANTYGDVTPVIPQGSVAADSTYTNARYFVPTGSNRTTGTTNPSPNINGTGQYGYLYNWCAALSNQPAACQGTAATQPNQSTNDGTNVYNVCPANWRLPTGNTGGELAALNTAVNGGSTSSPSGLLKNSLYMNSGFWTSGAFTNQNVSGYYWSSTVGDATNAYRMYLSSTTVDVANNYSKRNGNAIRCVSSATDPAEVPNPEEPGEGPEPTTPTNPGKTPQNPGGQLANNGGDTDGTDGGTDPLGEFEKDGNVVGTDKLATTTSSSIVPIVVGSVVLAAGVGTVIFVAVKRRKKSKRTDSSLDSGQDW